MKMVHYIFLFLLPVSQWWYYSGAEKSKVTLGDFSNERFISYTKKSTSGATTTTSYPPKEKPSTHKRRVKGTDRALFLISATAVFRLFSIEKQTELFTRENYISFFHCANGKRGPPFLAA